MGDTNKDADIFQRGIYNIEYFSGSQVAVYIGDIWVDEITSMSYSVSQRKQPIYGYADDLFRTVSKGQVLVQGSFTINFKEAGYLWLVLDHYNKMRNKGSRMNPFRNSQDVYRDNIETFIDNETDTIRNRNEMLSALSSQAALTGFSSEKRFRGTTTADSKGYSKKEGNSNGGILGKAEDAFEHFEDLIWSGGKSSEELDYNRRADDPELNNFEIYLAFGDFAGDNRHNHTIQKITNVHIIGSGKQIVADGQPIQEEYSFIGRNLI
jgi:hypothetical protein